MEDEAWDYIIASPTLQPHQRIELYNQQYWWRLLTIMHDNFPFLTRLFGYVAFNEIISVPFICHYRPDHWALARLGERLPKFLKEHYKEKDKRLIHDAATLDLAYMRVFTSKHRPSLDVKSLQNDPKGVLSRKLYLQGHVVLLTYPYHLLNLRDALMKEKDGNYWLDNPLPELEKGRHFHFVLQRSPYGRSQWRELTSLQYNLLKKFKTGTSVSAICEWLESQQGDEAEEALTHIHLWFQEWMLGGWLSTTRRAGL